MAKSQSAALDRKKLMADPVMVGTILVLIAFLTRSEERRVGKEC